MMKGARSVELHLLKQRMIQVGQLQPTDVGSQRKRPLKQRK